MRPEATDVVLLPSLDPERDGVAGFGIELARHCRRANVAVALLAPTAAKPLAPDEAGTIRRIIEPTAAALTAALTESGAGRVLLHYVGFGYAPDACPEWVRDGLAAWKRRRAEKLVRVYFHELATEEPWWKRLHWAQSRQRKIITDLVQMADRIATNCPRFQRLLEECHGAKHERLILAPVPSNLAMAGGGIAEHTERRTHALIALVFGLPGTRRRTLAVHARLLAHMAKERTLARVLVVGHDARPEEAACLRRAGVAIAVKADVTPREFGELAAQADFGLVWNWPSILTKSSVFANLCALGVPAVIARRDDEVPDSGLPGEPAIVCDDGRDIATAAARIADPALRAELRENALRLAGTILNWSTVASALGRHFDA